MNVERLKRLRDHIAALPPENFIYGSWFIGTKNYEKWKHGDIPECGSPGCVAGHTVTLFRQKHLAIDSIMENAAMILGLDREQSWFLFMMASSEARLEDAIKRLDWLIAGKSCNEYPWDIFG